MTDTTTEPDALERVRQDFTERLPAVTRLARLQHRRLHGELHDDAVAETVARTWHSYRKMALAGEDPGPLLGSLVRFAARHVRAGKLLGRSEPRDVLSRRARRQGGYHVTHLPHTDDDQVAGEVRDALRHHGSGPADEAVCNVDYQAWLAGLSDRQRAVAEALASGLNLSEVAQLHGVSKASVQQVRATLSRKWDQFHGEGHGR